MHPQPRLEFLRLAYCFLRAPTPELKQLLMKPNKKLTFVFLIFCLVGSVNAHLAYQENGITALKSAGGILLVWNEPDDYFTLEIKGKEIRPLDSSPAVFFVVDGIPFQIQSVALSEFLKDAGKPAPSRAATLVAHRDWETRYLESTLGQKLNLQSQPLKLKSGSEALLWKYDMPKGLSADAKQQLYLSVVNGQNLLLLNGVVTGDQKEEVVRQLLVNTMETLKVSAKPFNLREVQESLRGDAPR